MWELGGRTWGALRGAKLKEEKAEAEEVLQEELDLSTWVQTSTPLRELCCLLAVPSTLPVRLALSCFQDSSCLPGPQSPTRPQRLQDPLPLLGSQTVFFVFGIRHTQVLYFTLCEMFFWRDFFFFFALTATFLFLFPPTTDLFFSGPQPPMLPALGEHGRAFIKMCGLDLRVG